MHISGAARRGNNGLMKTMPLNVVLGRLEELDPDDLRGELARLRKRDRLVRSLLRLRLAAEHECGDARSDAGCYREMRA